MRKGQPHDYFRSEGDFLWTGGSPDLTEEKTVPLAVKAHALWPKANK
jgi:hypothetical protein